MLPRRRQNFKEKGIINDWQTLVETLLQWEQWLISDKLHVKHVKMSEQKHRHLMYLMKKLVDASQEWD